MKVSEGDGKTAGKLFSGNTERISKIQSSLESLGCELKD